VLSAISGWKDVALVVAILAAFARAPRPKPQMTDALAAVYAVVVLLYAVVPQSALGGDASTVGILYALRHDLLPVEAYALGRLLNLSHQQRQAAAKLVVGVGLFVSAVGLIDIFFIHLSWWRSNGTIGWFTQQLHIEKTGNGLSGMPENFILNEGGGVAYRRLVSTFLSPLAAGYALLVAFLAVWCMQRRYWWIAAPVIFAGLLWTHTRAAWIGLLVALACLLLVEPRRRLVASTLAIVAVVGAVFYAEYQHIAPRATFTAAEAKIQAAHAAQATGQGVSSNGEHLSTLHQGAQELVHHPLGLGLGNVGVSALRSNVVPAAGESTYTEIGVETGIFGLLAFVAWSALLVAKALRRAAWVGAALVGVFVVAIQTDIIGVPWLALVLWAIAGDLASGGVTPKMDAGASPAVLQRR
jgi:hypothetical protein